MKAYRLASGLSGSLTRSAYGVRMTRWTPQHRRATGGPAPTQNAGTPATNGSENGNGNGKGTGGKGWGAAATAAVIGAVGFGAGVLFTRHSPDKESPTPRSEPIDTTATTDRPPYASPAEMLVAAKEIAQLLGEDAVTYDPEVLEHHGHSDWSTSNSPGRAVAVVYPRSTEDVSAIARICHGRNVPMVPFGAGSSIEGNFSQPHSGICIDFAYMDKIIAFHPDDMDVVVQPGVNWMDLNRQIADSGLFAPMDPSPTASVGGMISTNCSGTNAFRYGTMKDWVLNLTVVLADGTVIKTRRRPRKTSAGYNLTSLFVGAEGTLGMVTEATLKLAPIPQDTSVAVVPFPTIRAAAAAATAMIRSGIQLAALEIMDEQQMAILNAYGSPTVRKRHWAEQPTLFLKFSGTTDAIRSDIARIDALLQALPAADSTPDNTTPTTTTAEAAAETAAEAPAATATAAIPFHFARSKQEEHDLWAARKEALFTMTSTRPSGHAMWSTDVAVPISRLAEMVDWSKAECSQLGIFASVVGHVGDGNFHVAMTYDPADAVQAEAVRRCVHRMMDRALEMEGTVSGEHAIGIGKKACLVDELGVETIGVMRRLKKAVDPKGVMNPGKVFD